MQPKASTVPSTAHSRIEGWLNIHDIDKDASTESNVNGVEGQDTNTTKSLDDKNESAITIASSTCKDILQNQNIELSGQSTLVEADVNNKTVVDKMANSNDSTVTLTKIECKNSNLSVTVTPSSSSLASNISDKDRKHNEAFFPDSEELHDMSMLATKEMDSLMNEADSEQSQNRDIVSAAEDVKNNLQDAVSISEHTDAQEVQNKPEPELVDEPLQIPAVNAEITDDMTKPSSPPAEIIDNAEEIDTSHTSENSASILQANVSAQCDEKNKNLMAQKDEVASNIIVPDMIKPLVDYDDTFTDVTQPTVEDTENEKSHEESDSDLTQEFVSLSEIPTSQLDTSILSEFESDSNKEEGEKQSERKAVKDNAEDVKKKKKRLGNTGIVKKVKVKGKEITDDLETDQINCEEKEEKKHQI